MIDQPWTVEPLLVPILVVAAIVLVVLFYFWLKGRPFAKGDVFRASRWSRGNRWFPTQVLITPSSVVHYTPQALGRREHSIHIAHVASVGIDTHILFSDVIIETTGGTEPVRCYGHRKRDAVRMKNLIERYQTAYYREPRADAPRAPDASHPEPASGSNPEPASDR